MSKSNQIRLYHFTDTRNLASIRERGGLYSSSILKGWGIDVVWGGNEWSHDADAISGMDQYVHLCLTDNHPMEYHARADGRIKESIFIPVDASIIQQPGVLYSPGVSNKAGMETFPAAESLHEIDVEVLYSRTDWSDPEIKVRLAVAKKCEILVPDCIPLKFLREEYLNG